MKLNGKITRILANFYYVTDLESKTWECFARGRLLKEGKLLFVGDDVEIEISNPTQGVIVNVLDRKNKILKPPIANIDQVLVVFSTCEPDFDFYNLDRYLSFISYELPNEKISVCMNKTDLKKIDLSNIYKNSGYEIFYVSALKQEGLEALGKSLVKKTTVLTGPSGVGKSSLIKALAPNENIKIGSLSSIKQGKHITRNVQLISIDFKSEKGFLGDTPGFTQFSFAGLKPHRITETFNEFKNLNCAFANCLHMDEEGCALKNDDSLQLPDTRLDSYRKIIDESKSETIYGTKEESKIKYVGGKSTKKDHEKILPKIDQEMREKSRKKNKQDLRKYKPEDEDS